MLHFLLLLLLSLSFTLGKKRATDCRRKCINLSYPHNSYIWLRLLHIHTFSRPTHKYTITCMQTHSYIHILVKGTLHFWDSYYYPTKISLQYLSITQHAFQYIDTHLCFIWNFCLLLLLPMYTINTKGKYIKKYWKGEGDLKSWYGVAT